MVTFGAAAIVVVPFPFSNLSGSKLRPAVILAATRNEDWLLCQITSNPYQDPDAIQLTDAELEQGRLVKVSYARPMKLFTANEDLITKRVATLNDATFATILTATIDVLRANLPEADATDADIDSEEQATK